MRLESFLTDYVLELTDPDRHLITIDCHVRDAGPDQIFRMASWIPGSYLLREYARLVVRIEAYAGDAPVDIRKLDKSAWQVAGTFPELTVRCVVIADDLSVRGAWFDRHRAYFNGTCVFVLPEGRESEAVRLQLIAPQSPQSADWTVATAMRAVALDDRGFGSYAAADFDELIDHPFEISNHETAKFEAADVPHTLVVAGAFDSDLERVATDLRQICETQIDFFGRPAPFDSYTFLGLAVGEGYGGLEHKASSSLIFDRNDLPRVGEPGLPKSYQRFLGLCSHEYFHAWHVKRTRPAAFIPYRLDRRSHTTLLWVFEGITTYYQDRFLFLSGLISAQAWLQRLADTLTRVYRAPGRLLQSVAQSSFDAWDSLYKPGPSSLNTGVSYYSKGALVAVALDLQLRIGSGGKLGLDDVVVELWRRYGSKDAGVGEDGFEALTRELAGDDIADFFESAVRGTKDIDLAALFAKAGIRFVLQPATAKADTAGTAQPDGEPRLALGAAVRARDTGLSLVSVPDGGAASMAGLMAGDVVVAIDGIVVSAANLPLRIDRYAEGDEARVDYIRDGRLLSTRLTFAPAPADTCKITLDDSAPEDALAIRAAWLSA